MQPFGSKSNVTLLWEIVQDESVFAHLTPEQQRAVYQVFLENLEGFFTKEWSLVKQQQQANPRMPAPTLMDLNKKYILLMLNHIRETYGATGHKIRIQPPMNDRKQHVDAQFERAKQQFEDLVQVKPPPTPTFQDDTMDLAPVSSTQVEQLMQAREMELQQLFGPSPSAGSGLDFAPEPSSSPVPGKSVTFELPALKLKPKRVIPEEQPLSENEPALAVQYDDYIPPDNLKLNIVETTRSSNAFVPSPPPPSPDASSSSSSGSDVDILRSDMKSMREDVREIKESLQKLRTLLGRLSLQS